MTLNRVLGGLIVLMILRIFVGMVDSVRLREQAHACAESFGSGITEIMDIDGRRVRGTLTLNSAESEGKPIPQVDFDILTEDGDVLVYGENDGDGYSFTYMFPDGGLDPRYLPKVSRWGHCKTDVIIRSLIVR